MVDYDRFAGFQAQVTSIDPTLNYMAQYTRSSPHLSNTTTPSPPYPQYAQPMPSGMSQPTSSHSRQPTSYPSPSAQSNPHSYPSPSTSTYAYPPPQPQQRADPYRSSPSTPHMPHSSLNLPPLRALDHRTPTTGQAAMGSPLPPPAVGNVVSYYGNAGHAQGLAHDGNITSSPHNQPIRYPLPAATDGRMMSGGRHKKEIKRRTKTGCLTCRKRRIKCDEAHPTCRNCQKSKRECLGYDPIFRTQPGPAAIQPAPTAGQSLTPGLTTPTSTTAPGPYPTLPQSYASPVTTGAYVPALSAGVSSPGSSVEQYEYATIDPALEATGPTRLTVSANSYDGAQPFRQELKGGLEDPGSFSPTASQAHNQKGGTIPVGASLVSLTPTLCRGEVLLAYTSFPAKRIKIDDLFSVGGTIPAPAVPSDNPALLDHVKTAYLNMYAPAIDELLETTWFSTRGWHTLLADSSLCQQFGAVLERSRLPVRKDDVATLAVTQGMETRLIWCLMGLPGCVSIDSTGDNGVASTNGVKTEPAEEDSHGADAAEASSRFQILESLLSGTALEVNPARIDTLGGTDDKLTDSGTAEFWHLIGELRIAQNWNRETVDALLLTVRTFLGKEARDIVYSTAVVRHLAGQAVSQHAVNDDAAQVLVAREFIQNQMSKATNVVFQRICGMVVRSWGPLLGAQS